MKVKIYSRPEFSEQEIIIYEERDGKRYVAKPVEFVFKEYKDGKMVEPTIRLGQEFSIPFMQAMADELSKNGIRTEMDKQNEGSLAATKYHLSDLRKLLKIKD
jgi:hypothetical protein